MQAFSRAAIFFQFVYPVMHDDAVFTGKLHERFQGGLTKFSGAAERNVVFAEEFQCDQFSGPCETSPS